MKSPQANPDLKANFVKLAINGERQSVYVTAQQFDKIFVGESFPNSKGTRWKVKGSLGGGGGLDYIGENIEDYKRRYEIKTDDSPSAWKALIEKEIEADTRKLTSFAAFQKSVGDTPLTKAEPARSGQGLKAFAEGRRTYLLNDPELKIAAPSP